MSQEYEGAVAGGGATESSGTVHTAAHEAVGVASGAAHEAAGVVDTAKSEAAAVAHEAGDQMKELYHRTRSELADQAAEQQRRVAGGLRSLGGELGTMAESADPGLAGDLVRTASSRLSGVADWIGDRDPGSVLSEVKSFARSKPGTFIAVAALAGLVAGRLTRALTAGAASGTSMPSAQSRESTAAGQDAPGGATGTGVGPGAPGSGVTDPAGAGLGAPASGLGATTSGAEAGTGTGIPGLGTESAVRATTNAGSAALPGIPPAPDGIDGEDAARSSLEQGDTPLYDQADAARETHEDDRP